MYVEIFVADKVWGIGILKKQIEKDFKGTYELKTVNGGFNICGECELMSMSQSKDWSFFYNIANGKLDYLIYFACGKDMKWMTTPICRMMQTDKSRAFSGGQINDMIRWVSSCLSETKWESKNEKD